MYVHGQGHLQSILIPQFQKVLSMKKYESMVYEDMLYPSLSALSDTIFAFFDFCVLKRIKGVSLNFDKLISGSP